jgi:hypothetical protein
LGLEFKLNGNKEVDPKTVSTFLLSFDKLQLTPKYLDEDSSIDITVEIELEDGTMNTKKATGITFTNGEKITMENIKNRSSDLSEILIEGFSTSKSFVSGTVRIYVDHRDINRKNYSQTFIVSDGTPLGNVKGTDLYLQKGSVANEVWSSTSKARKIWEAGTPDIPYTNSSKQMDVYKRWESEYLGA